MATRRQDAIVADYDVAIVGAGISGINFAYRLQERNPELSYCILDGRQQVGGTWSLFQYPGVRSDSDLYTFGFPWRPWEEKQPIARGSLILKYIEASAAEAGIDSKIKFNHRVDSMDWSSASSTWTLSVTAGGGADNVVSMRVRFVLLGTGYYDYDEPLEARIPGIDRFRGAVVHPQFWPRDLNYTGKNVVVIGSGATAVTLLPSMADKTAHTTMLQRSPTYILALPENDPLDRAARLLLPGALARRLIRFKWILSAFLLATVCRWFPRLARAVILWRTSRELPSGTGMKPHFTPRYNPWEQRMCISPGGDFFRCLRAGKASVETGVIEQVTENTIRLESGRELHPDIIVTATGLKVQLAGGIDVSLDGRPVHMPDCYSWKGCMLENLPNLFYFMGYVNASWTLGADATAQLVCRLLNRITSDGFAHIVPRLSEAEKSTMSEFPFLPLNSTYVHKGKNVFPKVGNINPWLPRSYYWKDLANAWWGDVQSGLEWST
ncbi:FAD-containing monooxygenase EthA-like [Lolium rigidum]|uniref:FAD-containing monooxygenase EthA-like n=1 Tax=Lolium rigidum TaxID=89674 RepID=UPI001F5D5B6A|nr:FAD-containing monooxygenase EthA-like [Lolium rigidum]